VNRKQRRALAKECKKNGNEELAEKVMLFDKLPDHCLTCNLKFDKMNKEQVATWSIVVRNDKDTVRLYCPDCWEKAKKLVEGYNKLLKEKEEEE